MGFIPVIHFMIYTSLVSAEFLAHKMMVIITYDPYCLSCTSSSFAVPSQMTISRLSHQLSPSSAILRVLHDCFRPSPLRCCHCAMSLVFHAFVSHTLFHVSYTSPARTRRLWLCGKRRRAYCAQQIRVAKYVIKVRVFWWKMCYGITCAS